jgi:hypothetical protein
MPSMSTYTMPSMSTYTLPYMSTYPTGMFSRRTYSSISSLLLEEAFHLSTASHPPEALLLIGDACLSITAGKSLSLDGAYLFAVRKLSGTSLRCNTNKLSSRINV